MKYRNNKGFTGVDISISLIIIVLFVSILASLLYNYTTASKDVNRKATATNIAILKIEEIKQSDSYDTLEQLYEKTNEKLDIDENGQIKQEGPYLVTTRIQKYSESKYTDNLSLEEKSNLKDLLKIATVTVKYSSGNNEESVELSTVITKEN